MPHVDPPRRHVRDVVGDAALLVLADGKRAVVWPRQARGVLVARRTNIYQRAVEGRETRVADVVRRVRAAETATPQTQISPRRTAVAEVVGKRRRGGRPPAVVGVLEVPGRLARGVRGARLLPGRALARLTELPLAPPQGDAPTMRAIGDRIAGAARRPGVAALAVGARPPHGPPAPFLLAAAARHRRLGVAAMGTAARAARRRPLRRRRARL